jgi:hypothetical protein
VHHIAPRCSSPSGVRCIVAGVQGRSLTELPRVECATLSTRCPSLPTRLLYPPGAYNTCPVGHAQARTHAFATACTPVHLHICTSARPRFSTPSLNLTRCSKDTTLPSPHQGQTVPTAHRIRQPGVWNTACIPRHFESAHRRRANRRPSPNTARDSHHGKPLTSSPFLTNAPLSLALCCVCKVSKHPSDLDLDLPHLQT